jgi:hypothetical protein
MMISDDRSDHFCEELEYVFDQFPTYNMKNYTSNRNNSEMRIYMKLVTVMGVEQ